MLLRSFDSILKKDFFTPQEILYGKSLCDICLSDHSKIKKGLRLLKDSFDDSLESVETFSFERSVVYDLLENDL